ncbi:Predicted membrane protein [Rickettsia akari str. Hartford]|uniref:Predicted membrane protein n=1 Tax=Rickettsia akari (strain Hartford) TaxID=293614 RepID=A8GNG0_RICAH|nr:YqaA family protein [Rickettsia akari]ABV74935.1 Predicted membrane protein [Rickettsia akari str. Hartford]
MNQFEAYSLLFVDSFVSNLIIGFQNELIFHSMKVFAGYNSLIMLLVAICAALSGHAFNYIFGRIVLNIFYASKNEHNILRHKSLTKLYYKYEIFIIFLMAFPFWGCFISLFSGFVKTKFLKFLVIGCLAKVCYYALELYIF